MKTSTPRVTLYGNRRCPHCRATKTLLQRLKIPFREFDVERNHRAMIEFQRQGGRGVPLVKIGRQTLQGFDARRLKGLLRKAGFDA